MDNRLSFLFYIQKLKQKYKKWQEQDEFWIIAIEIEIILTTENLQLQKKYEIEETVGLKHNLFYYNIKY